MTVDMVEDGVPVWGVVTFTASERGKEEGGGGGGGGEREEGGR